MLTFSSYRCWPAGCPAETCKVAATFEPGLDFRWGTQAAIRDAFSSIAAVEGCDCALTSSRPTVTLPAEPPMPCSASCSSTARVAIPSLCPEPVNQCH